jgi:GT2 family glycosyltransferase
MEASIVIVTRNRYRELSRALLSCIEQHGVEIEILVFDDDSSDETKNITKNFGKIRYFRSESQKGYIYLRNEGFRLATGTYVFSLDDDAFFTSPDTVKVAIAAFQLYTQAAAFALRYEEPGNMQCARLSDGQLVRSFVGCAHAVNRDIARSAGGYRDFLVHQGEEKDLCLRLWDKGYEVRYIETPPIVHCPSSTRNVIQHHSRGIRNTILCDFLNTPLPYLPWRLAKSIVQLCIHSIRKNGVMKTTQWLLLAAHDCYKHRHERAPVTLSTFQIVASLPFAGPCAAITDSKSQRND